MRIVFAGTPEFAAAALAALIAAAPPRGWSIPLVLSQPDRPAGRGMKFTASAVKQLAVAHGVAVDTPVTLSLKKGGADAQAAHDRLRAVQPDVLVVAAYGLILPQAVLDIPRGLLAANGARVTALNIHASLLPRWRGAAPIARAIEAGDATTGITIMQMEAGLDTGPMLLAQRMPIDRRDTGGTLAARLAECGALLIVRALDMFERLTPLPQPESGVTYARKIEKNESALDFTAPAAVLERRIRAFDPFPGVRAALRGTTLKFWSAEVADESAPALPGTVLRADASGIHIACAGSVLVVGELQRPGARRLPAHEFLAGFPIVIGERFEPAAAA
jgi:methionyl-tRNA formyltransferase